MKKLYILHPTLHKCLLLALLWIAPICSFAQTVITGTVTSSETGETLPGVNVVIKGQTVASVTDLDGSYSLQVPNENASLVFSFIGFTSQEIPVGNRSIIDVSLVSDTHSLDEVVVLGYGTQRKINLTGSVSTVDFEDKAMESRPLQNMSTALAGMAAGLQVNQSNGRPGSGASISLRGIGSLNAGSAPLLVIDGNISTTIDAVNPDDVASVTVLKDAASSAIYGSRASNGVILITTKSGRNSAGKVTFGYTGNVGVSEASNTLDFITDTGDHLELINQVQRNSGLNPSYSPEFIQEWRQKSVTDPLLYPNTDWWDVLLRPGRVHDHNLSARGGNDRVKFFTSLGYQKNTGIVNNTTFENFNFRNNLTYRVNDWLELGNIVTGWFSNNDPGSNGIFSEFIGHSPGTLPRHPDGRYGTVMTGGVEQTVSNALRAIDNELGEDGRQRYTGKLFANLTPVEGLTVTGSYFIDMYNTLGWSTRRPVDSWNFQTNAITRNETSLPINITNSTTKQQRHVFDFFATYEKSIRDHNFSLLAGYNQEYFREDAFNATSTDLPTVETPVLNAALTVIQARGNKVDFALRSYFGRLTYNLGEKYLFEANVRADGSSRFSPENRWGVFPSASVGWVISEEQFWAPLGSAIELVKIRASYGRLGNNNIGNYDWQSVYDANNYSFGGQPVSGLAPNALANRDITWETTDILNIGADIQVGGFNLTVDYYDKLTHGILARTPIPFVNGGLAAPLTNSAEVRNHGLETEVNYRKTLREFSLSIGANASYNKNKIVTYQGDFLEPRGYGVWTEGQPIGKYWLREVDHIIQDQEEIDALVSQGWTFDTSTPDRGDFLYRDHNGDQRIDVNDRVLMGNPIPLFNYGGNLSLSYKNLDFYTQVNGVAGYDRITFSDITSLRRNLLGYSFLKEFQNSWTEENTNTHIPKLYATDQKNNQHSDYFLRSADYLRIRAIQLGYSFPAGMTERLQIQSLRVYINLENYFTFTSWPGLDPEAGILTYPITKTASLGINLSF